MSFESHVMSIESHDMSIESHDMSIEGRDMSIEARQRATCDAKQTQALLLVVVLNKTRLDKRRFPWQFA